MSIAENLSKLGLGVSSQGVVSTSKGGTGNTTGVQGSSANYASTYFWEGTLELNTSTKRYYIPAAATLQTIKANLVSAGQSQSTITINLNGVVIDTIVIAAGQTYVTKTVNNALSANDYITVNITQVSSASDLYVTFIYRE